MKTVGLNDHITWNTHIHRKNYSKLNNHNEKQIVILQNVI